MVNGPASVGELVNRAMRMPNASAVEMAVRNLATNVMIGPISHNPDSLEIMTYTGGPVITHNQNGNIVVSDYRKNGFVAVVQRPQYKYIPPEIADIRKEFATAALGGAMSAGLGGIIG